VIVLRYEAKRIYEGRKERHRLALHRKPPEPGRVVPITYREPNEALGYTRAGTPRLEANLLCYIRVTSCDREMVSSVTADSITAEGYPHFDDFVDDWPNPDVLTWVIGFHLEPVHRNRLLSNRIIAGHQGNYVTSSIRALEDAGEAVDPLTQAEYAEQGRERDLARFAAARGERAQLPFELRLASLRDEARRRHIDVRDELRAIERWRDPAAREKQLAKMRAKLDHPLAPLAA